jgi:hypothetical protein
MLVWIFERQHFEVWDNGRRPQKPKVVALSEVSKSWVSESTGPRPRKTSS